MSYPSWPVASNFPQDILLDDDMQLNDNSVENEMESGPPAARLRDTVSYATYTGSLLLSTAHRATMRTFWESDTKYGTIPFHWKDPVTQASGLYKLQGPPSFRTSSHGWFTCSLTFREVPQ